MAGKGGGAWKVAYADFVTAMMAFFMVMWLLAQDSKVKDAVAKTFRNETGRYAKGDSLLPPRHDEYLQERLPVHQGNSPTSLDQNPKNARRPFMLAINNGNRTAIGTAIAFPPDSAQLDAEMERQLADFATAVAGKPQKIEIRGHASRPARTQPDADLNDWAASYQRCQAVMQCLLKHGVDPARIRLSQAGATEPYLARNADQSDPHGRVEIFVLNEVAADAIGTQVDLEHRLRTAPGG